MGPGICLPVLMSILPGERALQVTDKKTCTMIQTQVRVQIAQSSPLHRIVKCSGMLYPFKCVGSTGVLVQDMGL